MTTAKSTIDSIVESGKSTFYKTTRGTTWRNSSGKLHRTDGPAREWSNGSKEWHVNGKLHRIGAPAVEWADGTRQWWFKGKLHRIGGPAVEYADGAKEWWVDGKRHNTDGPAIKWDGIARWFVNGRELTEEEFNLYVDQTAGEVFIPPGKKLTHDRR
jgi:hypothetical protein